MLSGDNNTIKQIMKSETFTLHGWAPQMGVVEPKAAPTKPIALQMSIEGLQCMESDKTTKSHKC